tara:strand:- start:38 stop:967 length:930 start_codon:yes stop_codon:yes gene_type:complete
MKKKLTIQISEGLGNQLFMYAFAYSLSKKLNYDLYIDNKSGFSRNKNLLRNHQFYMLNNFNIIDNIAYANMIYDTPMKIFQKKLKLFFDIFFQKKSFLIEKKIKLENKKIVEEFINLDNSKVSNNLYLQGNFENSKYFLEYKHDLVKMFTPKNQLIESSNPLINKIKNSNSISLHIRRNRFSDQRELKTEENIQKSNIFVENIINYINNSIDFIESKVSNPEYFIWSNDHVDIDNLLSKLKISKYTIVKNNVINDFNLFRYCKHFIVGPSSFHWWGAWLNNNPDKICIRPSNINPSNNKNFWPDDWLSI